VTSYDYDFASGKLKSITDPNGQTTTAFYNDALDRLTSVVRPTGGGQTNYFYGDQIGNLFLRTQTAQTATQNLEATVYFDGLGRTKQLAQSEGTTSILADTVYDGIGRVSRVSNPYRAGDTVYWTTTQYDALGRVISVASPDNAVVTTTYSGTTTTVTDQAGKQRRTVTDGLGRLTQVVEAPSALSYQANYQYDVLDDLTVVSQGVQTRSFVYDSLKRLKQATNPESGTVSYQYDANSNLTQKTDARGVVTSHVYDGLNRPTSRSYTNDPAATPAVTYSYDSAGVLNSKGRLTSVSNAVSTCEYLEYDALGRIKQSRQTTVVGLSSQSYTMSDGYDLAGNVTSETLPSGRQITTSYDSAGRISTINGQKTGEANRIYASSFSYAAHGAVASMNLGNGLCEHTAFNSRLQPMQIGLGGSASDSSVLKLDYSYGTTNNNGNVLSQRIVVTGAGLDVTQSYTYDEVNRLKTASEVGWSQTYDYDRYGNRAVRLGSFVSNSALTPQSASATDLSAFDQSNNRLRQAAFPNVEYDGAGNLTRDHVGSTFTYDGENRQITSSVGGVPASYFYDGDGHRVKKGVGPAGSAVTTVFVYNAAGQLIAEYSDVAATGGGGTSYLTQDHLGSTRVVTDSGGNVKARHDYLPYGEEIPANIGGRSSIGGYGANNGIRQKFTQKERDAESGLDWFGPGRYYSSPQGRFTSADPLLSSGKPSDPQTWNRYAYALNGPLRYTDPLGMWVYDANVTDDQKRQFERSLERLRRARDHYRQGSAEYNRLNRAYGAYGTRGVDNGVTVRFAPAPTPGNTNPGINANAQGQKLTSSTNPTGQSTVVTIDPSKNSGNDEYAFTIAHEGSHVADVADLARALPTNLTSSLAVGLGNGTTFLIGALNPTKWVTESRAYETEAFAAQA